jgi:ATP-dependent Clp protease ATP-binding subunit ClpA
MTFWTFFKLLDVEEKADADFFGLFFKILDAGEKSDADFF